MQNSVLRLNDSQILPEVFTVALPSRNLFENTEKHVNQPADTRYDLDLGGEFHGDKPCGTIALLFHNLYEFMSDIKWNVASCSEFGPECVHVLCEFFSLKIIH